MARVTIEDCLVHVDNPFDLVLLAAKRARKLSKNPALIPKVPVGNNKFTVVALREIAAGFVDRVLCEQAEEDIDMQRAKEMALAQKPVIEGDAFDD